MPLRPAEDLEEKSRKAKQPRTDGSAFVRAGACICRAFALVLVGCHSATPPPWHDAWQRLRHTEPVSIVRVRAACARDLPALRVLFRRSSLSNEGDRDLLLARPEVLELTDEGITEGRTQVAVGAEDEILGFITTRWLDVCTLEIEDLFVDPDWMRTGVASRLVKDLLAAASRNSVRRIEVKANPHANAFYRRVGFVHGHDTETRLGGAPRMYLELHADEADQTDTRFDPR